MTTRKSIVQSLLDMHAQGHELRSTAIRSYNPMLYRAIYYRNRQGKRKYFWPLNEARYHVADKLEELGDNEGAERVRELNKLRKSPANHSLDYYLNQLIKHVESGSNLDRKSIEKVDRKLVGCLVYHFGNYYEALRSAEYLLLKKGQKELSEKANPEYWRAKFRTKRREIRDANIEFAQDRIVCIKADKTYYNYNLGISLRLVGPSTGREVVAIAQASGDWLTSQEVANRIKTSNSNVSRYFPTNYPDLTIRIETGQRHTYLYHVMVLQKYKRINKRKPPNGLSLNIAARRLNIGPSKLRNIVQTLALGNQNDKGRSLSSDDIQIIKRALGREESLRNDFIASIYPEEDYTFRELEILGIPTSHFYRMIRSGDLKAGERNGTRTIPGRYALDYLQNAYSTHYLSHGLRLITFFHPHLYTLTDLIQRLGLTRDTLHKRIEVLLDENPDICFRIKKSENRSKILTTKEVVPFIGNWESRTGLQLISMADKLSASSSKKEVKRIMNEKSDLINSRGELIVKDQLPVFFVFRALGDFLKQTIDVNGTRVSQRDLALLYQYMIRHDYTSAEIGRKYNLREIRCLLYDSQLVGGASDFHQRLGFALFNHNRGLIGKVMQVIGRNSELYVQEAEESLMKAVEGFDPTRGFRFSSYAFKAIQRGLQRKYQNTNISLDAPIKDDAKMSNLIISYREQNPLELLNKNESVKNIGAGIDEIVGGLPEKYRNIIIQRFGLYGRKRKTLEEIAEDLEISRENVRQLESKALKRLANTPTSQTLKIYLE